MEGVCTIQPWELADIIRCRSEKVLIVDARTFCEYNTSHIINSVNVWSSKIRKKRLQQNSISVHDFLQQACHISLQELNFDEVVVYDQSSTFPQSISTDTFLHVLLLKLSSSFQKVFLLQGGFLEFQSHFYEMCEDSSQKNYLLTSFSQPCLPVTNTGPTKILPFLFLGSQHDANNKQLLLEHNISYELNVSTSCPQPDFLQDSHFLRIAVNDNFSARLLPHFAEAFRFIDKVREVGGRVLVHCLAGISRSPTVVISYVMKYLHLHYDEAYRYVKTRRPTISPNINFVGQLLELDLVLFGNSGFCRSPPGTHYLDPECMRSYRGSSPAGNASLLSKSSSSPCIESFDELDFAFHRNQSLPSLRVRRSLQENISLPVNHHLESPSSEVAILLSNVAFNDGLTNQGYVSDRLPSSPLFHQPNSPEYSAVLAKFDGTTLKNPNLQEECRTRISPGLLMRMKEIENEYKEMSVEPVAAERNLLLENEKRKDCSSDSAQSTETLTPTENSNFVCRTVVSRSTDSFDSTISVSNSVKNQSTTISNTTTNVSGDTTSLLSTMPGEAKISTPKSSLEDSWKVPPLPKKKEILPYIRTGSNQASTPTTPDKTFESSLRSADMVGAHHLQHSKPFLFPPASAALKKEYSCPSDSNNNSNSSTHTTDGVAAASFPPKTGGRIHLSRKTDPPYLPRSHSSSETYLNRRTRLERQAAANAGGANTRKSFSSDEVGRGFQSPSTQSALPTPTTPTSSMYPRETCTNNLELARCDSWSTSGLGSEISDWDSIQDDIPSAALDDAQGPFDAVFSEVFPGEGQNSSSQFQKDPISRKLSDKTSTRVDDNKLDLKMPKLRDNKENCPSSVSLLKSGSIAAMEESLVTCPTPRPVSLPGVSGSYNITDANANVDMGLGLDENLDWQKDVHVATFSPSTARKNQVLIEHPPVSPRTMGEDVKYIMTWYKIDSTPQQALLTPQLTPSLGSSPIPPVSEEKGESPFLEKECASGDVSVKVSFPLEDVPQNRLSSESDGKPKSEPLKCGLLKKKDQPEVTETEGREVKNVGVKQEVGGITLGDSGRADSKGVKFVDLDKTEKEGKVLVGERGREAGDENIDSGRADSNRVKFVDLGKTEKGVKILGGNGNIESDRADSNRVKFVDLGKTEKGVKKDVNIESGRADSKGVKFVDLDKPEKEVKVLVGDHGRKSEDGNIDGDEANNESGDVNEGAAAGKGQYSERWQWWDNEFKKKIRNIKKNVSLTPWDSVSSDEEGKDTGSMAGFHLAQELMQSMEDLLEREICDIKEHASALSSRFGLPVKSSVTSNVNCDGGTSITLTPAEGEAIVTSGKVDFVALPVHHDSSSDSHLRGSPFGLKTAMPFASSPTKGRAKSEPPLCTEEGLYRVKSCPGIAQGDCTAEEDTLKLTPQIGGAMGPTIVPLRHPQLLHSRYSSSKRLSCSALDFLTQPHSRFEFSCPDVRQLSGTGPPSLGSGESGSGGAGSSPSASFSRLLKVS